MQYLRVHEVQSRREEGNNDEGWHVLPLANTRVMRAYLQVIDKEIEDMTLEEVRVERKVHNWSAHKFQEYAYGLERRLKWLEYNKPLIDLEDAKGKFQRHEITDKQYSSLCASAARRRWEHEAVIVSIEYARRMETHERSVCALLDERKDVLKTIVKNRPRGKRYIDPRKKASRDNPKPDWLAMHPDLKRRKPLRAHSVRLKKMQEKEKHVASAMKNRAPITTWDYDKFYKAARSAGYYSKEAINAAVAQELECTLNAADRMLQSGNLSWAQTMLIGALFEMPPSVFCDVFMSGYFKEIATGKYIAYVEEENKDSLRADLTRLQAIKQKDEEPTDEAEEED